MSRLANIDFPIAFATALAALLPSPVIAQQATPPAAALEEIVVTAERRRSNVQDTPLAVTSLGSSEIARLNLQEPRELTGRVPNLFVPNALFGTSLSIYYIRGVGESDTTLDTGVGLYLDDVIIPRAIASNYPLPDLERIEVIRGPQGTLYGQNNSAGTIRFITRDPGLETEGQFETRLGNYDSVEVRGRLSGALISDKLFASASAIRRLRDGYTRGVTLGRDLNSLDILAGRLKLRYDASDDLRFVLALDAMRDDSPAAAYPPRYQPNGNNGVPNERYDSDKSWISVYPAQRTDVWGVALTSTWAVSDRLALKSVTAMRGFENSLKNVNDGGASLITLQSLRDYKQDQFSQELQVQFISDRVQATFGALYFDEDYRFDQVVLVGGRTPNVGTTQVNFPRLRTTTLSGYGQLRYQIFDRLAVTAGARYSDTERDFSTSGFVTTGPFEPIGASLELVPSLRPNPGSPFSASPSLSEDNFSPRLTIEFEWSPRVLQYFSYGQGYKSGGFDVRASNAVLANASYDAETVTTYEAGLKAELFDGRVRSNFAVFYSDYEDLQISAFDAVLGRNRRFNAAGAENKGIEVELSLAPMAGLTISANAGYLDAKFDEFSATLPTNRLAVTTLVGRRLPYAPRLTGGVGVSYETSAFAGNLELNADVQYSSYQYTDAINDPEVSIPEQATFNLGANYRFGGGWLAGFRVENLFDNRKRQGGSFQPTSGPFGLYTNIPHTPRFWHISLQYAF